MSKTTPVQFRGRTFWAFDVSLSILLAELIDIAEALSPNSAHLGWRGHCRGFASMPS